MMVQFRPTNRIKFTFGVFYTFVFCVTFNSPVLCGSSSSNDELTSSLGDLHDTFVPEAMFFDSKRIPGGSSSEKISSHGESSPSSSKEVLERSDNDGFYDYYEESLIDDDKSKSKSNESTDDSSKISKRFGFASPHMMPHIPSTLSSMKRRFDIPSAHNSRNFGWSFRHTPHLSGMQSPLYHSSYTPMESAPPPSMVSNSNNLGRLFNHVRFAESRPSPAHVAHHHDHTHKHHHHSPLNATSRVSAYASYGVRNKATGNRLDPAQSESKTSSDTRTRSDIPLHSMHDSPDDESSRPKDSRDFDIPTSDSPLTASASDKDTANDAAGKYDQSDSENDPDSYGGSSNSPASSKSGNSQSLGRYRINTYSQHSVPGNRRQAEQEAMRSPRYRIRPRQQYQGMPPPMPPYEGSLGGSGGPGGPGGPYGDPMAMGDGVLPPSLAGGDPEGMPLYGGEEYALTGLRGQLPAGLGGEGTYPLIGGPNPMPPFHFPMGGMPGPMGGMPGSMGGSPLGGPGGVPMGGQMSKPGESGQQQSASSNQADYSVNNLQKMHPGLHPMQYQYLSQWYSYLNQPMIRSYIENFKDPNESNDDKQKQSASNEDKSSSRWFRNLRLFPLSLQKIQLPRVREIFDRIRPQTTSTTTESSSSTEFA